MTFRKTPSGLFDALLAEADTKQCIPPQCGITRASLDGVVRKVAPLDAAGQHVPVEEWGGELASKLRVVQDSTKLSTPGAMLRTLLGDFLIDYSMLTDLEPIGEGGFATVYRAEMTHRNGMTQTVAVKKLRAERVQCDEDLKEFIAEGNLWRKLQSKDVVQLMGIGAEDLSTISSIRKSFFIVCEYLHGPTVRGIVQQQMFCTKKDVYNTRDVLRWFIGIARGIKYLHSCCPAIIHRDLKPENVLLTSTDAASSEAKVLDLGLHIRGRARSHAFCLIGDRETSFYGGDNYDAVALNGSVRNGRAVGQTLKEKCLNADLASPQPPTLSLPPPSTRHGSCTGGELLKAITEDAEPSSGSGSKGTAAAPQVEGNNKSNHNASHTSPKSCDDDSAGKRRNALFGSSTKTGLRHVMSDASIVSASDTVLHTAKVGSWMYMAPEMVNSHHYSEKVDVFAMSVMLYEALKCRLNVSRISLGAEPGALQEYAEDVSNGFREEIPSNWPQEIVSLIKDGWHQDASLRITATEFLLRVSQLLESGVPDAMDNIQRKNAEALTGCVGQCGCSIM